MFSIPFLQIFPAVAMGSNGSAARGSDAVLNATSEGSFSLPLFPPSQFAVLDFIIPGFSVFSSAVQAYLGIDLNVYIPLFLVFSGLTFVWNYFSDYLWNLIEKHLMSSVRIRTDDEIYNIIMSWVAAQRFSQGSRRCIVNTNVNSRSWFLWRWSDEDEEESEEGPDGNPKKKPLQYTPSGGHHFFWYKGCLLRFDRNENRDQASYLSLSQREEISISCFSRNPRVLKELLVDARAQYMKKDEKKTLIYRGAFGSSGEAPSWQRCMSRSSRPFDTVILNDKIKKDLIEDVTDYLLPTTRRWYANRGIPYRRGYLLYGPPGTGKSSLSLALAGFFQMRIYMVSLSSAIANEEHLTTLFAELPRRCVVLLEDIDTAGLTHTREGNNSNLQVTTPATTVQSGPGKPAVPVTGGRLSLSGLLNILDGVASQEGRILIMTTNHLEKLDKALIRPGRVDMIVQFGRADTEMTEAIFRAIYAPYEGEEVAGSAKVKPEIDVVDAEEVRKQAEIEAKARTETLERVGRLAKEFSAKIPSLEFSPAEIQGLLLKHKRHPEKVIEAADEWVIVTRKEKKEKEREEAEKLREEEEEKAKEEKEKAKEEEKAKKKELRKKRKAKEEKARMKAAKAKKKAAKDDADKADESDGSSKSSKSSKSASESGSGSGSDSDSDTDSESEVDEDSVEGKTKKGVAKGSKCSAAASGKVDEEAVVKRNKSSVAASGEDEKEQETSTTNNENRDEIVEDKSTKSTSDSGYDTPDHTS